MNQMRDLLRDHWVAMLIGCLIPLAALAAIVGFGTPVGTAALIGLLLICPLGYFVLLQNGMNHKTITKPGAARSEVEYHE